MHAKALKQRKGLEPTCRIHRKSNDFGPTATESTQEPGSRSAWATGWTKRRKGKGKQAVFAPAPEYRQECGDCTMGKAKAGRSMTKSTKAPSLQQLAASVATKLSADVFTLTGGIEYPLEAEVARQVRRHKASPNAFLIVTTGGGSADVAYQVARCFQRHYGNGHVSVCVHSFCKSAGTLIALGADEIVMTDDAHLGPLDVQVGTPDEIGEHTSGLSPAQALNFLQAEAFKLFESHFLKVRFRSQLQIMTRTAAELAVKMTVGLFQPIYQQLDPLKLGEIQRSVMIAYDYGERLCRGNFDSESLMHLIGHYPSHSFVIDRDEASLIFKNVRHATEGECMLLGRLFTPEQFEEIDFNKAAKVDYIAGAKKRGVKKNEKSRSKTNETNNPEKKAVPTAKAPPHIKRIIEGSGRAVRANGQKPV